MSILKLEEVYKDFQGLEVLFGVNMEVVEGERHAIIGPNGAGKSTLFNIITGLYKPSKGKIFFQEKDISGKPIHKLARMGLSRSFQIINIFTAMTVFENVALPLREHTDLEESIIRIMARLKLEVVELAGFEDLMPAELSGGMLKRAALARAVVMDPKLLFCDEPSAGLDPVVAAAIDDLILRLRDALRITIVIVTHELESAFKIADRIAVLDKGEILMGGDLDGYNSYAQRGNFPQIEHVVAAAVTLFPCISRLRLMRTWGGVMDMTMDGSPIIAKLPVEGLYLDGGWCYGGFKATPGSGWVFAHTIARNRPHRLNEAFTLERFMGGRLLDEKGAGATPGYH